MYIDDSSYKLEQSRGKIAFDVRFGKGKMKNEKGEWRAQEECFREQGSDLFGCAERYTWRRRELGWRPQVEIRLARTSVQTQGVPSPPSTSNAELLNIALQQSDVINLEMCRAQTRSQSQDQIY